MGYLPDEQKRYKEAESSLLLPILIFKIEIKLWEIYAWNFIP